MAEDAKSTKCTSVESHTGRFHAGITIQINTSWTMDQKTLGMSVKSEREENEVREKPLETT